MTVTRPTGAYVAAALAPLVALGFLAGCSSDDRSTTTTVPTDVVTVPTTATSGSDTTVTTESPSGVDPTSAPSTAAPRPTSVRLRRVATLDAPTAVVARVGSTNLYATERAGLVRVLRRNGNRYTVAPRPLLDVRESVGGTDSERGLLGLAFSPDGGSLIVSYTDDSDDGASVVERYTVVGDEVEPSTRVELLRVDQPFPNHNGGHVVYGPDDMLYIGLGDGGSQGDPSDNGQDLSTPLAKILRIDPSRPATAKAAPLSDNPFVGDPERLGSIWLTGVRNPWRFSFDRSTGDLWIGDVGGSLWEEVDFLPAEPGTKRGAGRGANLGWSLREGAHDTDKSGRRPADLLEPIFEYDHSVGNSITGGFVYRGTRLPGLVGTYLYSDFITAKLWGIRQANGALADEFTIRTSGTTLSQVVSFAEDLDGELYVVSLAGAVLAIEPAG